MMDYKKSSLVCDQVKTEPTMEHWYCGNPVKHLVNGKNLCTFHANKLRMTSGLVDAVNRRVILEELKEKASERHDGSAVDAFKDNQNTISQQIAYMETQLKAMAEEFSEKPKDWGYVGNQSYVMQRLNEILQFLG